jgi:hypothetical protein
MESSSFKNFLKSFGSNWLTGMSGSLSVPITISALFVAPALYKWILAASGVFCLWFSSYRIWANEREKAIRESEKLDKERTLSDESGPFISLCFTCDFKHGNRMTSLDTHRLLPDSFGGDPLEVKNDGDSTALDVQIQDIVYGEFKATFDPINTVSVGGSELIFPRIERDGHIVLVQSLQPLLKSEYRDSGMEELFSKIRIPIQVKYHNMSGQCYLTECVLEYHYFHQTSTVTQHKRNVIRQF